MSGAQIWAIYHSLQFYPYEKTLCNRKVSSNTDVAGLVHQRVTVGPQARWLQQLVYAVGQSVLEDHEAFHYPGLVVVNQYRPLETQTQTQRHSS